MLKNQKGAIPVLFLIAALGLLAFVLLSASATFKDELYSKIFSKPSSHALSAPVSAPIQFVTPIPRPTSSAIPSSTLRPIPKNRR